MARYTDRWNRLGREGELRWLPAGELRHPEHQRQVREERVREIMAEFDPDGLGVFLVSLRKDGEYYVLDGQHRLVAVVRLGNDWREIPCLVYSGLTLEQEQRICWYVNAERLPWSSREAFAARKRVNDLVAESISEALADAGLTLVEGRPGVREVAAVRVLERIDRQGGEAGLRQVLRTLAAGWGEEPGAFKGNWLLAVWGALQAGVEPTALVRALRGCTPAKLEAEALRWQARAGQEGVAACTSALRRRSGDMSEG